MSQEKYRYYKSQVQGPLLWLLIPIILGYSLGSYTLWPLTILGIVICCFKPNRILLALSLIGLFAAYYDYRKVEVLDWGTRPEREVEVTIRVDQPFNYKDSQQRGGGLGVIINTPTHLNYLKNQQVSYFLWGMQNEYNVRSSNLEIMGILQPVSPISDNNFERYLSTQNIGFQISRGEVTALNKPAFGFYAFCNKAQLWLENILRAHIGNMEDQAGILVAMMLGNKGALGEYQKETFKQTGSLHLFAISGLHVGVIAAVLAVLLKLLRVRNCWAAIIGLLSLFLYVEITGGAPSAMRAFLMVSFYWSARVFLRQKEAFSALLASAILVLLINPLQLWHIGFQLSYAVVAAILLYGLPLNENLNRYLEVKFGTPDSRFDRIMRKTLGFIVGLLVISIAANLLSIPLSMHYFGIFAPGAIVLSLFLMPLASMVIILGFISIILGLAQMVWLSALVNELAYRGIYLMELCVNTAVTLPALFSEISHIEALGTIAVVTMLFSTLIYGHIRSLLNRKRFYMAPLLILGIYVLITG